MVIFMINIIIPLEFTYILFDACDTKNPPTIFLIICVFHNLLAISRRETKHCSVKLFGTGQGL